VVCGESGEKRTAVYLEFGLGVGIVGEWRGRHLL